MCQWRHWRNELVLCKSICHPILGQNSNFFHHISSHLFYYLPFVAWFCYLCELIQLHKSYVNRLYCHFVLDHVKNEIWLNVYIYNGYNRYVSEVFIPIFGLLLLRYGALEATGLKNEMSGGNAMEKQPGCENCACGSWERWKLQQTLGVTPWSY